jgi:hypothetical protein
MAGKIAKLFGFIVLAASGMYVFVYLYRWEWNRALISAAFFLAAELALFASAILDRLRRLDAKIDDAVHRKEVARSHLQATAPPARDHFAWLSPSKSGELNVFVPVLLGAGVVLSALAWLVERLSRATAGAVMEDGLARRMGPLVLPSGGLVPERGVAALLDGPVAGR